MAYDPTWSNTSVSKAGSDSSFGVTSGGLSSISSGIADLFDKSAKYRRLGNRLEADSLRKAAGFSLDAAGRSRAAGDITEESTRLSVLQQQRKVTQVIGSAEAAIASSGFAASGSALDILRDSTMQGELERGVIEKQGLLDAMGFENQALSYEEQSRALGTQAEAADLAATAAKASSKLQKLMGGVKIAAGIGSFFTGGK